MKKLIGMVLAVFMLTVLLAACGNSASSGSTSAPAEDANSAAASLSESSAGEPAMEGGDLPTYKIAFMYGHFTDKVGSQFKSSMEYVAADMNIEFAFIEAGYGEEALAAIEAAVAAGDIDGIIAAQAASPALIEACGGVPIISVCNGPASEQEAQEVATYENFLGSVMDSDYEAGYAAAQALYDAGCRNVCLAGLTQGMTRSNDDRANAFKDFLAEHDDMELLAEDYSRGLFADSVSSFAAAYPEMDGIFVTSGSDAVLNTMVTEGLVGSVKLATVDVSTETGTYFENDTLVYSTGGQYGSAQIGLAILYNYLADGTRIIGDTSGTLTRDYITMISLEEYNTYTEYVESGVPVYTAAELLDMIHYYNADVNEEFFVTLCDEYTLEDVYERHKDMI